VSKIIPYARQDISQEDIEAVVTVLKSDYLSQGPVIHDFEKSIARYCQVEHAIAVSNGTAALHLACLALGLQKGDSLWTSPNTFVASANCALYCGARVDFVDINARTGNIAIQALKEKLERAEKTGSLPKILIPVHFAGQACDLEECAKLAQKYGFKIIEDAAHAIGAAYQGEKIGSCQYSDITIFSFHAIKNMTCGEGGMLTTKNPALAGTLDRLRSHGIRRSPKVGEIWDGPWYYCQEDLGFNYRMTDIQAALGLSQHKHLDSFCQHRAEMAAYYQERFLAENLALRPLLQEDNRLSAWHLYVVHVEPRQRKALVGYLRKKGVMAHVHYIPVYHQPYYAHMGFARGYCTEMESYYASSITLPLQSQMTRETVDFIINAIKESQLVSSCELA
jgi:UDP-4-amino-4,6-dideoxy-N-acetyl-beta-L-altrosamine transaminase